MTVSHLWHSKEKYKSSSTCNQNLVVVEEVVTTSRDERSEKKHHVVDTEWAPLCQKMLLKEHS